MICHKSLDPQVLISDYHELKLKLSLPRQQLIRLRINSTWFTGYCSSIKF